MHINIKKSALAAIPLIALTAVAIGSAQAATESITATTTVSSNNTQFNANRPQLTDAQKETLKQVRGLYHQGKTSEAEALAKQAGLPERPQMGEKGNRGPGEMSGHGDHHKPEENLTAEEKLAREAKRQAIENAIAANDYATFASLIAGTPFEGKITQSNFPQLVEAQALMKAGNRDGAHTIMKTLGLKGSHPRMEKPQATSTSQSL